MGDRKGVLAPALGPLLLCGLAAGTDGWASAAA